MGRAFIGTMDVNGHYYYESAESTDDLDDATAVPTDVSNFVGRNGR